jgi:HEAT repeat protein
VEEEGAPAGIAWEADYDAALKKAKGEKRPIMVVFILRGEPANEEICEEHFQDREIVALSRRFVCLLALADVSVADGASTDGTDGIIAELEGRVSRKQLQGIESEARLNLLDSNEVSAPQFIFLEPDGKTVMLHHVWHLPVAELRHKMELARHHHDPSATPTERLRQEDREVSELLERCRGNNLEQRRDAIRSLAGKDHPAVISFLVARTAPNEETQHRLEAIRAMGQEGQVKFLPALHRMLAKESDYQIISNVAEAIGEIGLKESGSHLAEAIKRERKDNVRSLLIRALAACAPEAKETEQQLARLLQRGSKLDQITVLYLLARREHDPSLDKAVLKAAKSSNDKVRAAAYLVIGKHKLAAATRYLRGRASSERQVTGQACSWALAQLGEHVADSPEDPAAEIGRWLPDAAY